MAKTEISSNDIIKWKSFLNQRIIIVSTHFIYTYFSERFTRDDTNSAQIAIFMAKYEKVCCWCTINMMMMMTMIHWNNDSRFWILYRNRKTRTFITKSLVPLSSSAWYLRCMFKKQRLSFSKIISHRTYIIDRKREKSQSAIWAWSNAICIDLYRFGCECELYWTSVRWPFSPHWQCMRLRKCNYTELKRSDLRECVKCIGTCQPI